MLRKQNWKKKAMDCSCYQMAIYFVLVAIHVTEENLMLSFMRRYFELACRFTAWEETKRE